MAINITAKKMTINDALFAYIEEQIQDAVKVMDAEGTEVDVHLHPEKAPMKGNAVRCEVTLRLKDHIIRVEEKEEDVHAAVDVAAAKLQRQLRKFKTRVVDKRIQLNEDVAMAAKADPGELDVDKLMGELVDADDAIVREKDVDLQPLTTDQALVQMDLLGHDFFVYLDRDTAAVHVLYRRKDGGYGLLKTKA